MDRLFIAFYFFLLFYIALYGIHLYWLISIYLRYEYKARASTTIVSYPFVTIQLPVYNEKTVIRRLIRAVAAFDWPRDRLEIQVLDDSDDETSDIISSEIAALKARGNSIMHVQRGNRTGFKAGALAFGLARAHGEYIAVFDADNLPRPDFLTRLIPYFGDDNLGMVQARWSFLNRNQSLLCRAQALFLDAHFQIEQAARSRGTLFMNFNGTAGIWRRQAIDDAGGWQSDTLTEDLDLSYRAQMAGWRMTLAEDVDVPSELPESIRSFKSQQYRWARGAAETAVKILPGLLGSSVKPRIKLAAFFHLTQKTVSLALLCLAILLIPALYIRLEGGMLKMLAVDLPIFLAGTGSMSLFYGLAYRRQKTIASWRNGLVLPLLTSLGVALAINNSSAIMAALFSRKSVFIRTPKSGSLAVKSMCLPREYAIDFDSTVSWEMVLSLYTVFAIGCAAVLQLYWSLPFLMTFAFGFSFFTIQSLRERYA